MRADSPITRARGAQHVSTRWCPEARPPFAEADTLFLLDAVDEGDVLAQGGRLSTQIKHYFETDAKVALVPGPFFRKGVANPSGDPEAALVHQVDGLLPLDEFTLTFWLRSAGCDYPEQPSADPIEFLRLGRHLSIGRSESGDLHVTLLPTDTVVRLDLTADDMPADRWRAVSVVWDGRTLTLMLGDEEKVATASGDVPDVGPCSGADGGLNLLPGSGTPHTFEISDLHISRHARTFGDVRVFTGPTVVVDASESSEAYPRYMGGALGLYAGIRNGYDGVDPDVGTKVRDAQFLACARAGMPLVRMSGLVSSTQVTDRGPDADPRYVYDFGAVDDKVDLLAREGVAFHVTLDYNHPLTTAPGPEGHRAPPSDNELYAEICSSLVEHLKQRCRVVSVALWNEPDIDYWHGTPEELHALWNAIQRRFMVDHPDLLLGSGDFAFKPGILTHLDAIAAEGLPVSAAYVHNYYQDFSMLLEDIRDIRERIDHHGFGDIPIRLTEWHMWLPHQWQRYENTTSVLQAWPNRFRTLHAAAYCLAFVYEAMAADPLVDMATFSSIGSVDYEHLSRSLRLYMIADEAMLTNDDPPRPLPSFSVMSLLWKLGGVRVRAESTWPSIRALATRDGDTTTVVFGSYRPWRSRDPVDVSLEWAGLPERFRWRLWLVDERTTADGRLMLAAEGGEGDVPLGVQIEALGAGCIEIVPV